MESMKVFLRELFRALIVVSVLIFYLCLLGLYAIFFDELAAIPL
jgi:uncharacterized iron-regulated membrane protein